MQSEVPTFLELKAGMIALTTFEKKNHLILKTGLLTQETQSHPLGKAAHYHSEVFLSLEYRFNRQQVDEKENNKMDLLSER